MFCNYLAVFFLLEEFHNIHIPEDIRSEFSSFSKIFLFFQNCHLFVFHELCSRKVLDVLVHGCVAVDRAI